MSPATTTRQGKQHGRQNNKRIVIIIINSQNMYICDISLFLQYLTCFEHICLSFLVFKQWQKVVAMTFEML